MLRTACAGAPTVQIPRDNLDAMATPQHLPPANHAMDPGVLVCPVCRQASLQRRHRTTLDRMQALFTRPAMQLRRYACGAEGCGWKGLLRGNLPHRPGYLQQHWLKP